MLEGAFHQLTAEESFGFEGIMTCAPEPQIGHGFNASEGMRIDVVELEVVALATAPPLLIDESALTAVSLEHRSSNCSWRAPPAFGLHQRSALR
jgi:hypothetical protein